jgi:hypothetical protein
MKSNNQFRRLLFLVSIVTTLILEPFCLGWFELLHSGSPLGNFQGPTPLFFLATSSALLAGIAALIFGRSRWRWLLLLLVLPCAFALFCAIVDWYSVR